MTKATVETVTCAWNSMSQLDKIHIAALVSKLFPFEIIVGGCFTHDITVKVILAGLVS